MGDFGKTECCLVDFSETLPAHAIKRLIFVDGKNIDSGNSGTLMLTLINCWNELSFFERDLAVSGKDLKIGGIGLNNWWETNNLCWIKLHALQIFLRLV